jgi:hypothetical protein
MTKNAFVAYGQARLDQARRALHDAVDDFSVSDERVLELRENARRAFEELKELDREAAKKGFFAFLGLG